MKRKIFAGVIFFLFMCLMTLTLVSIQKKQPEPSQKVPIPTSSQIIIPTRGAIIKDVKNQGEADRNFSIELTRQRSPYPWYSKLPIVDTDYFVYFDLEAKVFVVKIYKISNNLSANRVNQIRTEIPQKLKGLGINPSTYPINVSENF